MVCGLISQVTQTTYIFFLCNHAVHEGCETRLDGVCLAPRCAKPLEIEIRLTPEMVSQRRFLSDYLQRLENFEDANDEMKALMNDMAVKTRDVERHFGPLISKEYIASIETLRKMEKSRMAGLHALTRNGRRSTSSVRHITTSQRTTIDSTVECD